MLKSSHVISSVKFYWWYFSDVSYGSCVSVEGQLVKSEHSGQEVELIAEKLTVLGECDPVVINKMWNRINKVLTISRFQSLNTWLGFDQNILVPASAPQLV